jgi:hypothetical protein
MIISQSYFFLNFFDVNEQRKKYEVLGGGCGFLTVPTLSRTTLRLYFKPKEKHGCGERLGGEGDENPLVRQFPLLPTLTCSFPSRRDAHIIHHQRRWGIHTPL